MVSVEVIPVRRLVIRRPGRDRRRSRRWRARGIRLLLFKTAIASIVSRCRRRNRSHLARHARLRLQRLHLHIILRMLVLHSPRHSIPPARHRRQRILIRLSSRSARRRIIEASGLRAAIHWRARWRSVRVIRHRRRRLVVHGVIEVFPLRVSRRRAAAVAA